MNELNQLKNIKLQRLDWASFASYKPANSVCSFARKHSLTAMIAYLFGNVLNQNASSIDLKNFAD